jgi:hypothetical protein
MLAGIILQLITMVSLALFYIWYFAKVGVWRSITLRGPTAKFNQLFIGTAICIVLVIIRGVYRTIELADGFDSPTAQNRACLDTRRALSDPFCRGIPDRIRLHPNAARLLDIQVRRLDRFALCLTSANSAVHPVRTLPGISFTSTDVELATFQAEKSTNQLATPPLSASQHQV